MNDCENYGIEAVGHTIAKMCGLSQTVLVNFYVNGSYKGNGTILCKPGDTAEIERDIAMMKRDSAKRWNVPLSSITTEY